jgi:polo-like kinase 1
VICLEKVKHFLYKGGFAKCYAATNMDTKKIYAVKVIEKASLNKNRAKQKV